MRVLILECQSTEDETAQSVDIKQVAYLGKKVKLTSSTGDSGSYTCIWAGRQPRLNLSGREVFV